jgi:hypothetical protein
MKQARPPFCTSAGPIEARPRLARERDLAARLARERDLAARLARERDLAARLAAPAPAAPAASPEDAPARLAPDVAVGGEQNPPQTGAQGPRPRRVVYAVLRGPSWRPRLERLYVPRVVA